jgi:hypothetical protein
MKLYNRKTFWASFGLLALVSASLFYACKPEAGGSLGVKPTADFATITAGSDANTLILINKSSGPAIPYWAVPAVNLGYSDLKGDSVKVHFIFAGTYQVKLMVSGNGGIDSATKTVTIAQNDPTACQGTAQGFIAGCTSKTWKLNPDAGAYKVGPSGPDDGSWWSSSVGDVTARSCEFNDTYTFSFDAAGTFVYDNKGDFYDDGYMGNQTNTCEPSSNYTAIQKPWGSGTFNYAIIPNAGVNKLGQLKVIGLGAHIGLQKVVTGGENTSGPVSSITYDIISMTHNAAGYDILKLGINLGYGWWTFTLRSY